MDNIIQLSYKYYNEALDFIKVSNISYAKQRLHKAIKLYGRESDIFNFLGSCEYISGNFNKAHLYWKKSIKINNVNNKAVNYLQELKSEKFIKYLDQYNNAIKHIHDKEYNKGILLLEELINLDTNIIEPYYIIGQCFIAQGEPDKAMKYLKIANEKDTGNIKYLDCLNKVINNKLMNKEIRVNKTKKTKRIFISNICIIALCGGMLTFAMEKNNTKHEKLMKIEKEKYKNISKELKNEKSKIADLDKDLKSFNKIGIDLCEDLYAKSLNYYKDKEYDKAVIGFEYISQNISRENYLNEESIYLTGLCYENMGDYDLAESYYSLYMDKYPDGNYVDYSTYNINKITN